MLQTETWAEPVEEEMRTNGYSRWATFLPNNQIRVMFVKGPIRGSSEGCVSDYSNLLIRAAIDAYEQERKAPLLKKDIGSLP